MNVPFVHSRSLWGESLAPGGPLVAFSELPRGRCPIETGTVSVNLVLEGEEHWQIDGRTHRVLAGELLVVDPGTRALTTLVGADTIRGLSIYLPQALGVVPPADPLPVSAFRFRAEHHAIGRLLLTQAKRIAASGATVGTSANSSFIRAANEQFDALVSQTSRELMQLSASRPSTRRHLLQRLHVARDYLLAHRRRAVPLAELATTAGMSPFHLTRCFTAVFGLPPARYHAAARLDLAREAIRSGHVAPSGAYAEYGFSDRSSFARAFRRRFGEYPAAAGRERG